MIDDSDFGFLVLLLSPRSLVGLIVSLWILAIAYFVLVGNHEDCEARSCPDEQKPVLMAHECLCATVAK